MQATSAGLTFSVPDGFPVAVAVAHGQVEVRGATAPQTKEAQRLLGRGRVLRRSGRDGAVLTLEGQARLHYERKGRTAEVVADRIVINLATGHVEVDLAEKSERALPPTVLDHY
jgi:hypothetical protein